MSEISHAKEGESVVEAIKPVLGQLTSFTMLDSEFNDTWTDSQRSNASSTYLESAMKELKTVQTLKIGLVGYDLATLFTLLLDLNALCSLSLKYGSKLASLESHRLPQCRRLYPVALFPPS